MSTKDEKMMGQNTNSFVNSNGRQAHRSRCDDLKMRVHSIHQGRGIEDTPTRGRIHG